MAVNQEEVKIPVFSVLKNGVIMKNIFLNNPNWDYFNLTHEQEDDFILIGRHPDCHIVLDHPSISRFHLEIRANPVLQKFVITDRDSVHGTWVTGKKIEPNVELELNEGDTLKLGASTRVYKLLWVNMSSAYELENPLPSVHEENEESIQLDDPNELAQDISLLFLDYNQSPSIKELMGKSPTINSNNHISENQISENIGYSLPYMVENMTPENNSNATGAQSEIEYKSPLKSLSLLSRRIKSKSISSLHVQTGRTKGLEIEEQENEMTLCRDLFHSKGEEENEEEFISDKENITPPSSNNHKRNQKSYLASATLTMKAELIYLASPNSLKQNVSLENFVQKEGGDKENLTPMHKDCFLIKEQETYEAIFSDKKNMTPIISGSRKSKKALLMDFENVDGEEAFFPDKENMTPLFSGSRKSKKALLMDFENVDREESCFSDKENMTPLFSGSRKSKKALLMDFENVDGEESYFSDKENVTPVASGAKKSKKELTDSQIRTESLIMERRRDRVPLKSLLENSPSKNSSSFKNSHRKGDKERVSFQSIQNSPLKNGGPLKNAQNKFEKVRVPFQSILNSPSNDAHQIVDMERIPFQSIQKSSLIDTHKMLDTGHKYSSFSKDELSNPSTQSVDQVHYKAEESKKKWIMVADTGCFLNEESRKSLQLLEGLKGTQLIIPRIVIRELDCLKRRESYFRKDRKVASSVLQWIEDCMVKSSWWVHVQSAMETVPIAPTPPATPKSVFSEGSFSNALAFSTCGSLMEIVSPTAEDHILDCGLLFKRIRDDGQLVLLTDSVTLKIKAMAEGLLCETPTEFRESLVNPHSKRFLWSACSPRGSTWSCLDDVGPIDDCSSYQFPVIRNTPKAAESIKGLKLLLLHNSHYAKTSSVS